MIEIVSKNKYIITCTKCGTKFAFDYDDVKLSPSNYLYEKFMYINCPICNIQIKFPDLEKYKTEDYKGENL